MAFIGGKQDELRTLASKFRHYLWFRTSSSKRTIIACRDDGLGERLNALLNALWLSEILGCGFKFSWSDALIGNPDHAIEKPEKMFSPQFIDKHMVPHVETKGIQVLSGSGVSLFDLQKQLNKKKFIAAPRVSLSDILAPSFELSDKNGLSKAFRRIGFSSHIGQVIELADQTEIPENAIGLHLRSGDIFFGDYRKRLHFTYKGITLPLAKQIIEKYQSENKLVCIFGQDKEVISYLCKRYNAVDAATLNLERTAEMDRPQRAIYDLVLLSRFKQIVAGTSGFAKQAAWIGAGDVINALQLFSAKTSTEYAIKDLEENANVYHKLQISFGYWFAYFYGRKSRDIETNIQLMEKACQYDCENELYFFILASLHFRNNDKANANHVLKNLFEARQQSNNLSEIFRVFTGRINGAFNLKEYVRDYEKMGDEIFWAACLNLSLAQAKNNSDGIQKWRQKCKSLGETAGINTTFVTERTD